MRKSLIESLFVEGRAAATRRSAARRGRGARGGERWPDPTGTVRGRFEDGSGTIRGRFEGVLAAEAPKDRAGDPGDGAEPPWASAPGGSPGRRAGPRRPLEDGPVGLPGFAPAPNRGWAVGPPRPLKQGRSRQINTLRARTGGKSLKKTRKTGESRKSG
jgi:hypothetical protein